MRLAQCLTAAVLAFAATTGTLAQNARPSLQESIQLGNAHGALCFMQSQNEDPVTQGMFDRSWSIVCRDAAQAVGQVYSLPGGNTALPRGGLALDGLVRAFIGAGARSVIDSYWPVPDNFSATQRLIDGLFHNSVSRPLALALRDAVWPPMDNAATSHPYNWADFAIIGDGGQQLIVQR